MTGSVGNAVATKESGPQAAVEKYRSEFAQVLPSHIRPETWTRLAVGALRRDPNVAAAATNNVGAFLSALLTAARLGLEPGTEQFYLVPQRPKVGAPPEIMGITGYQGLVELMYRAGAVSSVIVEVVRAADTFEYVPGQHERPVHRVDWFGGDRGALVGVYAYAVMQGGATSKVIVLGKDEIARIRAKSASAKSDYSPWKTDEPAMWMKSAARQLAKWVPTSSEYRRTQLRDSLAVAQEVAAAGNSAEVLHPPIWHDPETGEVLDAEVVEDAPDA